MGESSRTGGFPIAMVDYLLFFSMMRTYEPNQIKNNAGNLGSAMIPM